MAQYKVLQDIEAEDKLLGPLSLRQFIYAAIVLVMVFVAWKLAVVQPLLAIPFMPPIIFFAMLAAPFGHDQSSEVWMLAKIKYIIFPRKRIWSQDGIQNHVTITVPKVDVKQVTKDFDRTEATSRLKALATTMDTRGWAIKNVSTTGYQNQYTQKQNSDRLLDLQAVPQDNGVNVRPSEDVLDTTGNPLAQAMGSMQAQNQQAHRQAILQKMQTLAQQQKATTPQPVPQPTPIQPKPQPVAQPVATPVQQPVTVAPSPAILEEVKSPPAPTELHINAAPEDDGSGEVVISLH